MFRRKKVMKRLLIMAIALRLIGIGGLYGQGAANRLHIGITSGAGYGLFRDMGAGPLTVEGIEAQTEVSFLFNSRKWRVEASLPLGFGAYARSAEPTAVEAYGLMPAARAQAMRRVLGSGRWRLMAGGGLAAMFDFRYHPSLGNNGTGSSNFILLYLGGRGTLEAGILR